MKNNKQMNLPLSYEISGIKLNIYNPRWPSQSQHTPAGPNVPDKWRGTHSHFTFEVFFVTEGQLSIATDQGTHDFERKIVILPPKLKHTSFSENSWYSCLLFGFDKHQAQNTPRIQELSDQLCQGIHSFDIEEDTALYAKKVAAKLGRDNSFSDSETKFLIGLLFCQVIRQLVPEESQEQALPKAAKHINAIDSFINANRYNPITPSDIAENVFLSVRQVARIIEKEYHCTPRQLILERKLNAAEILIKNTDTKISDIAAMVKLGSDNYFYALFKNRYGKSPLQYRKEARNKAKTT